jgi:DDE superfamily endonuclease
MTLHFSVVPVELIFTFRAGNTTLQMLAMPRQTHFLSLIAMCGTICLNGVVPAKRTFLPFLEIAHYDVLPSPRNPKELFNLRHASARNAIERIFGILKRRFRILQLPPEYNMSIQALIPPALAALHNFIREYDPDEIQTYDDNDEPVEFELQMGPSGSVGELGGQVTREETVRANGRRDEIAGGMWDQYQHYLESRAARSE